MTPKGESNYRESSLALSITSLRSWISILAVACPRLRERLMMKPSYWPPKKFSSRSSPSPSPRVCSREDHLALIGHVGRPEQ